MGCGTVKIYGQFPTFKTMFLAPLVLDPEEGTEIQKPMQPGEDIDCTLRVPDEGITVKVIQKLPLFFLIK